MRICVFRSIGPFGNLLRIMGVLVAGFLVVGCAPAAKPKQRYFWPPFSEPKIEYIEFFQADVDVKKRSSNALEEAIFGQFVPEFLFFNPFDVYSTGQGKFYVSETGKRRVLEIDLVAGTFEPLTNSKGEHLELQLPTGLSGDSQGQVYLVDSLEKKLLIFGANGRLKKEWELAGSGRPLNVAVDEGRKRAYVVDPEQHKVLIVSLEDGSQLGIFGERGSGPGAFNFPIDLDLDADGNMYVLDSMNARVQVFTPAGEFVREFGERGTALGSFQIPKGIAVSPSGYVYVTDSMANRFIVFDLEGNYLLTLGGKFIVSEGQVAPGGFYLPGGVDVDADEGIWIVDAQNRIVHHFQYLTDDYLRKNPILEGQAVVPEMPEN